MKTNYDKNNLYSVYIFLDQRKNGFFNYENINFIYEPIYVGVTKNTSKRFKKHIYDIKDTTKNKINRLKINKFLKIKKDTNNFPIYIIFKKDLCVDDALKIEQELIKKIGRIQNKKGPLCNATDGGDGNFGFVVSNEHKQKLKIAQSGRKQSDETKKLRSKSLKLFYKLNPRICSEKEKNRLRNLRNGVQLSLEQKIHLSKINKGKIISEKQKAFLVKNKSKKYKITFPDKTEKVIENLKLFCKENELNYKAMNNVFRKKANQHRGFIVSTV